MTKVSIITTTYKHQDFIGYTIESILQQTYLDWELLIGDDSPDNKTRNIIEQYVKKYPNKIKAWHHKTNKGIVDNINFLIKQIDHKARYVGFLEGDDLYTLDHLSKKIAAFESHNDVALVYNDLSFIDRNNNIILESFFKQRAIPFFQNQKIPIDTFILQQAGPICSWSSCMVKREILEKYQITSIDTLNKRYSVADYDFYFKVAVDNNVFGIKEPLTLYRRHTGNLSGSNGGTVHDLEKLIDYYYTSGIINTAIYKNKKSRTSIVAAIFELEIGHKLGAFKNYVQALRYNFFSYPLFKIAILLFLLSPNSINKKILNKLIKRA